MWPITMRATGARSAAAAASWGVELLAERASKKPFDGVQGAICCSPRPSSSSALGIDEIVEKLRRAFAATFG